MNEELKAYYEARLEMFASKGWKDLIDDVKAMRSSTDTVASIDDLRKLGVKQGEISIMDWMISLQEVSELAYEELKNENS